MRKIHVLIPSLVATAGMPFVTLVGCGGDTPQPGKIEFSTSEGQMTSTIEGTFDLDWTPTDHSLIIDPASLKFESNAAGKAATVTTSDSSARPQQITITLQSEYSNDITDGVLKFQYEDKTTKQKDIAGEVNNIHITKYTPPPPPAPVEFDVSDGQMVGVDSGTLKLNANPSSHELEFHTDSWTFTSESTVDAYYVFYDSTTQTVDLDFWDSVSTDINDGVLSFIYNDKTTGVDNISVTIENVHLNVYVPPPPPPPPPGRINFNTCSWKEIYEICLEYEQEHDPSIFIDNFYFDDLSTPQEESDIPTSLDDFAGQQRIIHLDSTKDQDAYYVKVLGIGQDYWSTHSQSTVALTFQFDTAFGDENHNNVQWDDTDNDYWNSYIHKTFLNGELLSRVKDFTATSYIKPVYRTVASNTGQIERQSVYFFMPLLSNIFSTTGLTNSFSNPTQYINEGQVLFGDPIIQSQYTYYQKNIGNQAIFSIKDDFTTANYFPALGKLLIDGNIANYWLTTALMNEIHLVFTGMWVPGNRGSIKYDIVTSTHYYVAPCFCI